MAASTTIFLPIIVLPDHRRHSTVVSRWFYLLIASSVTTLILLYTLNIITQISTSPNPLIFQINSLSISNLNISDTKLAATWNTSFKVQNPNTKLDFHVTRIDGVIYYNDETPLCIGSVEGIGFGLRSKEEKIVWMECVTSGWEGDQPIVEYPVLRLIEKEYKGGSGTVRFGVRLNVVGTYYINKGTMLWWWWWWSRDVNVITDCLGLNVHVGVATESQSGTGGLLFSGPRICPFVVMQIVD
ncbi:hypothetical protein ACFE04_002341 [Oxalis oulophora]